ncbi:hypothetical protein PF008_g5646 [Phytophthora fragariae]|uniref:Calmodulin n=1 Tax=Phytophthora fragariae TaxID=53985 RepID=A0A6G0S815_9STRA|nr:hypothetical protein PF008_g5646 [Phytophthora fragariae]
MNPQQQHYATYNPQQQQQQQQLYAGAYATQSGLSAPPLHAWTPPSPQEQQYFDVLFAHVDDQRRNAIAGQQAVAFFTRSHLDKAVLREVWSIADTQHRSELSRNEFYVAMRLISLAQRGEQVSVQKFLQFAAVQYPLPMLEEVPPPQGMHPPGGMQQPTQQPAPVQAQAQSQTQQHDFGSVHQQPQSSNGAAYAVTADEKSKYDLVFQQYDTDRDGFLMGPEAVALFQMSGVDRNVLRDIWTMADVTQDSKLSLQEFYVAMHLIVCLSKRGLPMPQTLPRELGETAFGARGASQSMPGQDSFASQIAGPSSQNGFGGKQQQETVPPPKPEGMSAFDSLSTAEDAPLPSLTTSTPRSSSRTNSFNHADANTSNSHTVGFGEPSVPTPTGSLHAGFTPRGQQDFGSFSASRPPSITSGAGRDRTNSGSSMSSMSSFSGMAPLPPQQQSHQLPPRNLGSNERIQVPIVENTGFQPPPQSYSGFGAGSFGAPQAQVAAPEKPFMGDEEEKRIVDQLDQLNGEVVQTLANVERKQTTIEMLSDKLRDLDELRHELVTLVMKREDLRASSAPGSAANDNATEEQTRRAVERSLRGLVENQKQLIHQLQCDISRHEGELEEAILSAKLQQKMSLESRSPLIDAASPPPSTHDSFGAAGGSGATAFAGAPLSLDGSNALPSPLAAPSAPSISAFSPDATDSSGFNAFSNFDSAPRSISSATPSPAAGGAIPSTSPFSPSPFPSQSDAFGDFAALPSADAAARESNEFQGFVSAPTSVDGTVPASSPAGTSDNAANSPFSPFSPSPSPAATDDSNFGGFSAAPASSPPAAIEVPGNSPFSPVASPAADTTIPSFSSATGFESSPFSPSPAATDSSAFGGFESAPPSGDSSVTPAKADDGTANLIFSPVAADNNGSNSFGDFSAAPSAKSTVEAPESAVASPPTGNLLFSPEPSPAAATGSSESNAFGDFDAATAPTTSADSAAASSEPAVSSQPPTGNLLFSPEPSPAAATGSSGIDSFGDFSAASASTDNAVSVPAPDMSSGNSPFSPVAADSSDFNGFGDVSSASAPADITSATEKLVEASGNSPFSPVGKDDAGSSFETFGDFNAASASTDSAVEPATTASASGSSPFSPVAGDSNRFGDFSSASAPADSTSATEKPAEASGNSPFSPVGKDDAGSSFETFGDFNAASTSTDSAVEPAKTASTSGNSPFSPVAADSNGFSDFSSTPVTTESTTTSSETKPDNGGFEAFGDFSTAPDSSDNTNTTAAKDSSDSNGFGAFGDFSAAPPSTSTDIDNFN